MAKSTILRPSSKRSNGGCPAGTQNCVAKVKIVDSREPNAIEPNSDSGTPARRRIRKQWNS